MTGYVPGMDTLERFVVFDLETTGIDETEDRIVTAFIGTMCADGSIGTGRSWLVDPGVEIPEPATAVHGVTTDHAREHGADAAVSVAQIVRALQGFANEGIPVVAYNAAYDLSLLAAEARRHDAAPLRGVLVIDPLVLDKALDPYRRGSRRLTDTAAHYGATLGSDAHDARADAVAAGDVALALFRAFPTLSATPLSTLQQRQKRWARLQADSLTEYLHRAGRMTGDERVDGGWPLRDSVVAAGAAS